MNQTLNILNGQIMLQHFEKYAPVSDGTYIPFNEAMCVGGVTDVIFSEGFISERCKAHHVTLEEYTKITLDPLKPLFDQSFSKIVLWFDEDMFCQINLLTVLAYLNQIDYNGEVTVKITDHQYNLLDVFRLSANDFYTVYKQVLINRETTDGINFSVMEKGIDLYLKYKDGDNEIIDYIREHKHLDNEKLLSKLMKTFKQYGLGDTQYIELINQII